MLLFVFIILISPKIFSCKIIRELNEIEYHLLPRLFHMDPYEPCLYANNATGVYCSVKFDLVTDEPSALYDTIQNYALKKQNHFNHSKLFYGICLTKTCKTFYERNTTADRRVILEACLNDSMWREYKLKTRVPEKYICNTVDTNIEIDNSDIAVAFVLVAILLVNVAGTIQEVYYGDLLQEKGNALLACFGLKNNVLKLLSPARDGPDRLSIFNSFSSLRIGGLIVLASVHSMLPLTLNLDNPHRLEQDMLSGFVQFFASGTVMVQFYLMSSTLVTTFILKTFAEKKKIDWKLAINILAFRWLRLTPALAVVVGIAATWTRHLGSGPLWHDTILSEAEDCRNYWWYQILQISNYIDNSRCLLQNWCVNTETQLICVVLILFLFTTGGRKMIVALSLLLIAGMAIVAAHTYFQDLEPILVLSMEASRNYLLDDPTFNNVYKRGHTNLPAMVFGVGLGCLLYHWQKTGYTFKKSNKLRAIFWLSLAVLIGISLKCEIFYDNVYSLNVRTFYATMLKPVWCIAFAVLLIGIIYKFDEPVSALLCWQYWAVLARLCYSAGLVHVMFIKLVTGVRTTLLHMTPINYVEIAIVNLVFSILAAIPLYLLVEAPFNAMGKIMVSDIVKDLKETAKVKEDKDVVTENSKTNDTQAINGKTAEVNINKNGLQSTSLKKKKV